MSKLRMPARRSERVADHDTELAQPALAPPTRPAFAPTVAAQAPLGGHSFSRVSVLAPQAKKASPAPAESPAMTMADPTQRTEDTAEEAEVQRDPSDSLALPPVPHYQLSLPPPDGPPSGHDHLLHLDPQIEAMIQQHVAQQLDPASLLTPLSHLNLSVLPTAGQDSHHAASPLGGAAPSATTDSPAPAAGPAPPGAADAPAHTGSPSDLLQAALALPPVATALTQLRTQALARVSQDWRHLRTGGQAVVVSSVAMIGAGALAGIIANPGARRQALDLLNGQMIPVPGVNWLNLEVNTQNHGLMLGFHVDVGALLPRSLGFGPSDPTALGGPPTPQPFTPGDTSVLPGAQRQASGGPEPGQSDVSGAVSAGLSGGGQGLDSDTRSFMEPRFGHDFSQVKIHTDAQASQSTEQIAARAYTVGPDIAFRAGEYQPGSTDGKRLLAHELTHVVQQGAASPSATVQRDPAPPPAAPAGPNSSPLTPDFAAMPWQQLLPRAHGEKNGKPVQIATVQNDKDVAPTLNYDDAHVKTDPSKGAQAVNDPSDHSLQKLYDDASGADWLHDPLGALKQTGRDVGAASDAAQRQAARQQAFDAAVAAAVAKIVAARAAIPARQIDRAPSTHGGNFYDPTQPGWEPKDDPKTSNADWNKKLAADKKAGDPQGADYKKWIDAATPTGVDLSKPDDKKKWEIFKATIPLEGHVGEFTTFDKTLSIGVGFSTSGGQAQRIMGKVFNLLPEVKSVAEAAGLLADGAGGMTVVDASRKWILDGQDAAAYIQTDPALLSLLINVSQGDQPVAAPTPPAPPATPTAPGANPTGGTPAPATPAPVDEQTKQRQAFLDAEYQTYLTNTLAGIPPAILAWPIPSVLLASHSKHGAPAYFPWSFWDAHANPDLKTMVTAIYDHLKELDQMVWLIPICDAEPYRSLALAVQKEKEAPAAK